MSGLFEIPAGDERTVAAMRANLDQWQAQGKVLSHAMRRALLDQAEAVDLARTTRRATQISGANRVLLELLEGFHLLADAPPPTGDPLQAFLANVERAANGGAAIGADDDHRPS